MTLFKDLGMLESAGLIQVAKVEPDLEYLFSNSLVQDAAYASLVDSDRKRLHQAVGDAIENLYPDRKREFAAILGHHFKEAGQELRALSYFILAGDEALSVYANQEAEFQYRRALDLACCTGSEIAWLYSGLGEALYRQNRFDESSEAIRKGIEIYKTLGDGDGIARLYARLARVKWFAYERPEGLRLCLEGLEMVKDAPDSVGKAALLHEAGRAYYFNGMTDKALPLCRQALALAERLDAVNVQADTLATLGLLPGISASESLEALQKSTELAEKNRLLQIAMRAHQNLGTMIRTWLADNQTALQHFRRSAELGKMRGVASEEVLGLVSYVVCLFPAGNIEEIEAELPRLRELVSQISEPMPTLTTIKYVDGLLSLFRGHMDEAIAIIKECLESWRQAQNLEFEVGMLDKLTWVLLEKNLWDGLTDFTEIETYMQQALQKAGQESSFDCLWVYPRMCILRARQGRLQEARDWMERFRQAKEVTATAWDEKFMLGCSIEIEWAEHNWVKALEHLEKLAAQERRSGFTIDWARLQLCSGEILLRTGEPANLERAQSILQEALDQLVKLGEVYYADVIERKLREIQTNLHAKAVDALLLTKDLKKARHVQESLLPEKPPEIPGWGLEVVLEPAHETSGDFYDYLALPNGRLGMAIADVTDKGTSAALYMALSRSLWRTYALNHPTEPEVAMAKTNQRILADTHGGLFITLFYGILDPADGKFTYCSAGHHPAFLIRTKDGSVEQLERTGIPLGVFNGASWEQMSVTMEPGDALVLYTDGITDAQNRAEEFFGLDRLRQVLKNLHGKQAREVHQSVLAEVHTWMGNAPQYDDITLMVMVREK